jgi:hypothetical protein
VKTLAEERGTDGLLHALDGEDRGNTVQIR